MAGETPNPNILKAADVTTKTPETLPKPVETPDAKRAEKVADAMKKENGDGAKAAERLTDAAKAQSKEFVSAALAIAYPKNPATQPAKLG